METRLSQLERSVASNRANIATVIGAEDSNDRRSVNGMPVSAMGPENVVVLGANVEFPVQVVPYSGTIFLSKVY